MTEYGKPWRDRPVLSVDWLHRRRLQGNPDWDSFMKDFSVIDERGYPRWRTFEEAQSFMLTPAFYGIDFGCIHEEPLAYYLGAIMDASLQMEEGYHGEYVDRFLSYLGEPHSKRVMRLLSPAERDSVRQWMADWRKDNPDTHAPRERLLRLWIGQSMEGLEEPDKEFWNWDMEPEMKVPAKFLGSWFNGDWSRGDGGERITLNPDWTFERYVRFDPDSTAVGRFALKGKSELVITPQYYAVDAQRSGGSSPQELTCAKRSRTICLIRNGIVTGAWLECNELRRTKIGGFVMRLPLLCSNQRLRLLPADCKQQTKYLIPELPSRRSFRTKAQCDNTNGDSG